MGWDNGLGLSVGTIGWDYRLGLS